MSANEVEENIVQPIGEGTFGKVYMSGPNHIVKEMKKFNENGTANSVNIVECCFYSTYQKIVDFIPDVVEITETDTEIHLKLSNAGKTLSDWIKSTKQAERKQHFNEIFFQMIRMLAWMKRNRIAHMDIKPSNLCYNPVTRKLVLIDWGFASLVVADSMKVRYGTLRWADIRFYCPQTEKGCLISNPHACDMFSMSLIAYEIIRHVYGRKMRTHESLREYYETAYDYFEKYDEFDFPTFYDYHYNFKLMFGARNRDVAHLLESMLCFDFSCRPSATRLQRSICKLREFDLLQQKYPEIENVNVVHRTVRISFDSHLYEYRKRTKRAIGEFCEMNCIQHCRSVANNILNMMIKLLLIGKEPNKELECECAILSMYLACVFCAEKSNVFSLLKMSRQFGYNHRIKFNKNKISNAYWRMPSDMQFQCFAVVKSHKNKSNRKKNKL